jgi:UDP-N-acetylmuramyl tripeptide synthase
MAYALAIASKGSYLHVTVTGQNGRETVIGYFEEIRAACRTRDCYRVLVEERLTGSRFSLPELMQLAAEVSAQAGATFEVLAYVDVNAEDDKIQQVAGLVVEPGSAVGVFNTVVEAERWLRNKERR